MVLVGEIRDRETAEIAIHAALTGHLVFSTLHTNDASGAVTRLLEMGIEDFLLASAILGILAQRLVRRICPECRTAVPLEYEVEEWRRMEVGWGAKTGPIIPRPRMRRLRPHRLSRPHGYL